MRGKIPRQNEKNNGIGLSANEHSIGAGDAVTGRPTVADFLEESAIYPLHVPPGRMLAPISLAKGLGNDFRPSERKGVLEDSGLPSKGLAAP